MWDMRDSIGKRSQSPGSHGGSSRAQQPSCATSATTRCGCVLSRVARGDAGCGLRRRRWWRQKSVSCGCDDVLLDPCRDLSPCPCFWGYCGRGRDPFWSGGGASLNSTSSAARVPSTLAVTASAGRLESLCGQAVPARLRECSIGVCGGKLCAARLSGARASIHRGVGHRGAGAAGRRSGEGAVEVECDIMCVGRQFELRWCYGQAR